MRVLVACDQSDGAGAALKAAESLTAQIWGSRLLLVHVLNPLIDASDVAAPTQREAVEAKSHEERAALLRKVFALSGTVPAEARVEVLHRGEEIAAAIIRVASEWEADVIAIASRRVATLSGVVLGSVAAAVARDSQLPVLIVHP